MEEQKILGQLVIVGALILVLIVVLFIAFVISQKRKQSALKGIIDLMKVKNNSDYKDVKKELEEIREHLNLPKKEDS